MNDLLKGISYSEAVLVKIRELIKSIYVEKSTSISHRTNHKNIQKVEKLFKNVENLLDKIEKYSNELIPPNKYCEEALSSLKDSTYCALYNLNKIYSELEKDKKNIEIIADQCKNVENLFTQFTSDFQDINEQIEQIALSENKNYKIKRRRTNNVRHN